MKWWQQLLIGVVTAIVTTLLLLHFTPLGPDKMTRQLLPDELETKNLIKNMEQGEYAYVVPWAMWVDSERHMWLRANYTTHHKPGGTVSMRIHRVEDGFEVYVPYGETYLPSDGEASTRDLPVVAVTQSGHEVVPNVEDSQS